MLIIISTGYYNKHISNARSVVFGAFLEPFCEPYFSLDLKSPQGGGEAREVPSGLILQSQGVINYPVSVGG